jgi:hypothetical protein
MIAPPRRSGSRRLGGQWEIIGTARPLINDPAVREPGSEIMLADYAPPVFAPAESLSIESRSSAIVNCSI